MKRTTTDNTNIMTSNLVSLDGYIVNVNIITKNNSNNNHHYSFIVSLEDQSTVRVMKYLSKSPSCSLYNRLKESMRSGRGATITGLREKDQQYTCTNATKITEKELNFRPDCIRVTLINNLKKERNERLCTIEVKVCAISDDIIVVFEESEFKRIQKIKKNMIVGDSTGALEMTVWESQFNQIVLGNSYHIRLIKARIYNDQISLSAITDTCFIKIDDLENVTSELDNNIIKTHTLYGKIISIEKNKMNYTCQGCGGTNLIDEVTLISCKDCHSRFIKHTDANDDILKITILTTIHEEYNLKVRKSLILALLNQNNLSVRNNDNDNYEQDNLNTLTAKIIQFTFTETTCMIDDIILINGDESFNENESLVQAL